MDRKTWFIDFARIAGRRNLQAYAIGVVKSILCCNSNDITRVSEIRNAMDSMDIALNDESLPWDVMDAKKAPTGMEAPKKIYQPDYTTEGWNAKENLRSEVCKAI